MWQIRRLVRSTERQTQRKSASHFTISSDNESNLASDPSAWQSNLALQFRAVVLFMLSKVFKANREKNEQFAVLASMSEIYHRMYLVDLETVRSLPIPAVKRWKKWANGIKMPTI